MLHTNDKIVKHKVGLLNLADELGCSGQLIPDSKLSFSSARVGVNPLLY